MISIINSIALNGLNGYLVEVQTDISQGVPDFSIVGLPDTSVKESKERIKAAIKNSNIKLRNRKIVINMAPASNRKIGTSFDLAITVGILMSDEIIKFKELRNVAFIGELSLNGNINKVDGVLPMCIEALKLGIDTIFLPESNYVEASLVKKINIIPVKKISDVVNILNYCKQVNNKKINFDKILTKNIKYHLDFADVKGQENAKRALEIAAAGGHNVLMTGSPGVGKTMLARRIATILPEMSYDEVLEVTKIYSIAGLLQKNKAISTERPFRAPHYTITAASMIGGGRNPMPGEVSLAHRGVLFLDEFSEFNRNVLEMLRTPLEDKELTISRVNMAVTYPCDFMLVASMNPCKCGYYGSDEKKCTCSAEMVEKYISKISGPLIDRIDIQINVKQEKYNKITSDVKGESSEEIRKRVILARKIQLERYKELNIYSNAELADKYIDKYCITDEQGKVLLEKAFEKFKLSARAYTKILKISRTIADLDNEKNIKSKHIAEAIQYRGLDRKR